MAKPNRTRRAAAKPAPKAKPLARASKSVAPGPKAKPKAKPRKSTIERPKAKIDPSLSPEQKALARHQHRLAAKQIERIEQELSAKKITALATKHLRAMERKAINEAARVLATQQFMDMQAAGNTDHAVGTDKFWEQITPQAEATVRKEEQEALRRTQRAQSVKAQQVVQGKQGAAAKKTKAKKA